MSLKLLENFWKKPIYLPYVQKSLSNEMVLDAENQLGYKLPKSYIELLKIQNGGYTHYTIEDSPIRLCWGIGKNFPNILDDWKHDNVQDFVSFQLDGLIPFDGDGHWYCCFDYRQNSQEPQITFIDIECDEQQVIADNFDEYLDELTLELDNTILMIETDIDKIDFKNEFEKLYSIKFSEPSARDNGYEVLTSQTRYKGFAFFIYENLVPLAFVRENEENYEQLVNFDGKTAFLYPELNKNCIFLKHFDEEVIMEVAEKLTLQGFKVHRLADVLKEK